MVINVAIYRFAEQSCPEGSGIANRHAQFWRQSEGCLGAWVAQSLDDPQEYLLIGHWASAQDHARAMALLQRQEGAHEEYHRLLQALEGHPHLSVYSTDKTGGR
ncbi:MAG TPA: hypothetical protein GXZ96_01490 [Firmicutes bacterium]|jgi:quinol monooxygenase YgiN|nr:hypothetical protein [Bacillota bacterium]